MTWALKAAVLSPRSPRWPAESAHGKWCCRCSAPPSAAPAYCAAGKTGEKNHSLADPWPAYSFNNRWTQISHFFWSRFPSEDKTLLKVERGKDSICMQPQVYFQTCYAQCWLPSHQHSWDFLCWFQLEFLLRQCSTFFTNPFPSVCRITENKAKQGTDVLWHLLFRSMNVSDGPFWKTAAYLPMKRWDSYCLHSSI